MIMLVRGQVPCCPLCSHATAQTVQHRSVATAFGPIHRIGQSQVLGLGHPVTAFTVYSVLVFKFTRMYTRQICYLHEFQGKVLFTILGL